MGKWNLSTVRGEMNILRIYHSVSFIIQLQSIMNLVLYKLLVKWGIWGKQAIIPQCSVSNITILDYFTHTHTILKLSACVVWNRVLTLNVRSRVESRVVDWLLTPEQLHKVLFAQNIVTNSIKIFITQNVLIIDWLFTHKLSN